MSTVLIGIIAIAGVIVLALIGIFNRLVTLKLRAGESWAQIDVQLKKRSDLVPNLVEIVKGYAAHEKSVFENVTKARAMIQSAGSDVEKSIEANNMLSSTLKSLFAVSENYPELKANQNFLNLQTELAGIEDRVAYARQFYNESVRMYNEYQQQFPGVIFAGMFGHKSSVFFEVSEAEKAAPVVKF